MAYTMCQRGLNVVVPLWHHRPLIIIIIIIKQLGKSIFFNLNVNFKTSSLEILANFNSFNSSYRGESFTLKKDVQVIILTIKFCKTSTFFKCLTAVFPQQEVTPYYKYGCARPKYTFRNTDFGAKCLISGKIPLAILDLFTI